MEQWVNVQPAMFEDILDDELAKFDKFRAQLEEGERKCGRKRGQTVAVRVPVALELAAGKFVRAGELDTSAKRVQRAHDWLAGQLDVARAKQVAAGVGATAGTALVILRVRANSKRRRSQSKDILELAERTLRDVADEARNLLDR